MNTLSRPGALSLDSELFFQTLWLQSPDALLVLEREGKSGDYARDFVVKGANPAVQTIFGYNTKEIVGKTLRAWGEMTFSGPELLDARLDLLDEALQSGKPILAREERKTKGGQPVFVLAHLLPTPEPGGKTLLCLYRNLTRLSKFETEVVRSHSLHSLLDVASHVHEELSRLIFSPEAREILDRLLLFPDKPSERRGPHELNHDVRVALEVVEKRFARQGIPIEKSFDPLGPLISADPGDIVHILLSLLHNAEEALRGRNNACVKVTTREAIPYAHIIVEDNGPGVESSEMGRIFEPFYTTRQGRGGLGLVVAFELLKNYGGHLSVESFDWGGLRCEVRLPLIGCARGRSTHRKVLILDDDSTTTELFSFFLSSEGYEVETAADADTGLPKTHQADFVLLDILLPGTDGLEALAEIRRRNPDTKVIMISAIEDEQIIRKSLEIGAVAYLKKPVELHLLQQLLDQLHRKRTVPEHPPN